MENSLITRGRTAARTAARAVVALVLAVALLPVVLLTSSNVALAGPQPVFTIFVPFEEESIDEALQVDNARFMEGPLRSQPEDEIGSAGQIAKAVFQANPMPFVRRSQAARKLLHSEG